MTHSILMIALLAACFFAMALSLALEIQTRNRVMRIAAVITGVIGTVLYGYGYAWCYGINAVSMLRALLALCRMFTGGSDLSAIQSAPLFQNGLVLALFWIGHFLGFYVMASAVVATLGNWLLRRIRVTRLRRGPLLLVYGVNAHSVAYARHMAKDHRRGVLFVGQDDGADYESAIKAFGGIVEKSSMALEPSPRFLRQMNLTQGNRRLEVAALHTDGHKNLAYARALMKVLQESGIEPKRTTLLIAGSGDAAGALQAPEGGYGSVMAMDDYELTARLIIHNNPPCDMISFDEKGVATEDMHVVLVGFGRMGRALLTQLFVNGQFCGSHFRADIFDPSPQNGFLHGGAILRDYDIRFHVDNGMSDAFYSFLEQEGQSVRCIALCTGNKTRDAEIADDLVDWYHNSDRPPVILQAVRGEYAIMDGQRHVTRNSNIYESVVLNIAALDALAMEINQMYVIGGGTSAQNWEHCDHYSRASSRASADFFPAFVRASGRTREQLAAGEWPPDDEMLENLAKTEHLRWCAYMYSIGYAPMPEDVYARRAKEYAQLKAQGKKPGFAIGRDPRMRLHACLTPWEALDALSARENAVTGGHVDYKQLDRNNVLALSRVIQAAERSSENQRHG